MKIFAIRIGHDQGLGIYKTEKCGGIAKLLDFVLVGEKMWHAETREFCFVEMRSVNRKLIWIYSEHEQLFQSLNKVKCVILSLWLSNFLCWATSLTQHIGFEPTQFFWNYFLKRLLSAFLKVNFWVCHLNVNLLLKYKKMDK